MEPKVWRSSSGHVPSFQLFVREQGNSDAPFESGRIVSFELDHDRARVGIRSIAEWKGILLVHQIFRVWGPWPAARERRFVAGSASSSRMASSNNLMSSGFCIRTATPLSIATG
jgi:hypothetical protein